MIFTVVDLSNRGTFTQANSGSVSIVGADQVTTSVDPCGDKTTEAEVLALIAQAGGGSDITQQDIDDAIAADNLTDAQVDTPEDILDFINNLDQGIS